VRLCGIDTPCDQLDLAIAVATALKDVEERAVLALPLHLMYSFSPLSVHSLSWIGQHVLEAPSVPR
jgi:hypothetical protein